MNTWLSSNDPSRKGELERLATVIEQRPADLRLRACGRRFRIAGFRFRLVQADRNTIYRVRGDYEWFLKMPKSGNREVAVRERVGSSVANRLGGVEGYQASAACGVSEDPAYIITSRIDGETLSRPLYRAALWRKAAPLNLFFSAGNCLAKFHSVPCETGAPKLVRTARTSLLDLLDKAARRDSVVAELEHFVEEVAVSADEERYCHGNFGMENILGQGTKVTFIDFENCGVGSPNNDLAGITSQMLTTTLAPHLDQGRIRASLEAFLQGYQDERPIDKFSLRVLCALRIGADYVRGYCCATGVRTVCGVPIMRRHFGGFVRRCIDGGDAFRKLGDGKLLGSRWTPT